MNFHFRAKERPISFDDKRDTVRSRREPQEQIRLPRRDGNTSIYGSTVSVFTLCHIGVQQLPQVRIFPFPINNELRCKNYLFIYASQLYSSVRSLVVRKCFKFEENITRIGKSTLIRYLHRNREIYVAKTRFRSDERSSD